MRIATAVSDVLSQSVKEILSAGPDDLYTKLVVTGKGDVAALPLLEKVSVKNVLAKPVVDEEEAAAVISALWLWHDWLDRSHTLSQGIETHTGSFWHAIMHRREGDFNNAKYWYGKCRSHPSMHELAKRATDLIRNSPHGEDADTILRGGWDAYALVDFVETCYDAGEEHPPVELAKSLQKLEWEVLFEHTVRAATA